MKKTITRKPTEAELDSLIRYLLENHAFDPMAPTKKEYLHAKLIVDEAMITVYPHCQLTASPNDFPSIQAIYRRHYDRLIAVWWDANPEHYQLFVCGHHGVFLALVSAPSNNYSPWIEAQPSTSAA